MSLIELIASTNEMIDKIYPSNMRKFIESQQRIESLLSVQQQAKRWEQFIPPLKLIKYNNLFKILNGGTSIAAIVEKMHLGYFQYDFANFFDGEENQNEASVINESNRIKHIITNVYNDHKQLFQVSPREFEEMIAELLLAQGFEVNLTKQTRDNGYDILAIKKIGLHEPLKFLVECKRYKTQKVGVDIIRSFKEVINTENANRGIIVTTSYFTKDALKKQKETPYLLDYQDKDKVMGWVNEYWIQNIASKKLD